MKDMKTATGEKGAKTVVMLSQKQRTEQIKTMTSSVLVMGSAAMTSSTYLTQSTAYNNGNVVLNIINNMTGKESGVIVPDKNLQQSFIRPTLKESNVIKIIVIWVIPFIVAAVGVIVLLRRKNK